MTTTATTRTACVHCGCTAADVQGLALWHDLDPDAAYCCETDEAP